MNAPFRPPTPSSAFLQSAKDLLGPKGWSEAPDALDEHATAWRGAIKGETPFAAYPSATEEAAALLKLCNDHGVAVTPQGGNTSLVDGGTPHGEIVVGMKRMNAIRAVDPLNNSLVAEAGCVLAAVQEAAEGAGRFFPLSLGSEGTAMIGGLISTNAGGVAVLRYGMMRDLLLGLEVVLPDGRVWDGLNLLRKNNTGYDLKHLFAGAEGTLGLITAASLKLFPQTAKATAWVCTPTAQAAIELLALVRDHAGDTVTSFELVPANAVAMVMEDAPKVRDPLPHEADWRVLMELSMADAAHANETLENALGEALERGLAVDAAVAASVAQAKDFWRIRETIPLSKRAYGTSVNHDVSVPISAIPAFLEAAGAAVRGIAPRAEIVAFGHIGDGNIHYSACEPADADEPVLRGVSAEIMAAVHQTATAHGGSISAEHGVGLLKRDEIAELKAGPEIDMMRAVKAALDPKGIMNPGRVVET
ncbi:MAG: FAD-binding oxidoreductase [Pseudomonadota bacterium]